MNPLDFLLAMNDIDAAAVDEAIELMHGGTVGNDTREVINLNKHRRKTLRRSALIAAIVALLAALGAAAYATDLPAGDGDGSDGQSGVRICRADRRQRPADGEF